MRKSFLCTRSLARDTSPLVLVKKSILVSWERTPLGSEGLGWTWTASGRRIEKVTRNAGPVSNPITSCATAFVHKRPPSECWAIFGFLEWRYPSISCGEEGGMLSLSAHSPPQLIFGYLHSRNPSIAQHSDGGRLGIFLYIYVNQWVLGSGPLRPYFDILTMALNTMVFLYKMYENQWVLGLGL